MPMHYRQTTYKDALEIMAAVDAGVRVYQHHSGYEVIKDSIGQYLIAYLHGTPHASYIGLTWQDGVTLNGKTNEFFSVVETP